MVKNPFLWWVTHITKFSRKYFYPFLLLLLALILTRLPFFGSGYGADEDAWRVARASSNIWQTGHYEVSREPGYPLYEIANAPLWALGGSWAMSLATFVAFLFSLWAFYRLLNLTQARSRKVLVLLFAFLPLFWPNSATSMDYIWDLALLLWAAVFLFQGRSILAFSLIGLSVGFRPNGAVMFLPCVVYMLWMKKGWQSIIIYLVMGISIGLVAYSPALLTYGPSIFRFVPSARSPLEHLLSLGWKAISGLGTFGTLTVILSLVLSWRTMLDRIVSDRLIKVYLTFTGILSLPFLIIPYESAYLIPALPWLFLFLGRVLKPRVLGIVAAAVVFSGFWDVRFHQRVEGKPVFAPRLETGRILEDYSRRREILTFRQVLPSYPFPEPSLLILGWEEMFWFENFRVEPYPLDLVGDPNAHRIRGKEVYIVYLIPEDGARRAVSKGLKLIYLDGVEHYNRRVTGFDPAQEGGLRLTMTEVLNPSRPSHP